MILPTFKGLAHKISSSILFYNFLTFSTLFFAFSSCSFGCCYFCSLSCSCQRSASTAFSPCQVNYAKFRVRHSSRAELSFDCGLWCSPVLVKLRLLSRNCWNSPIRLLEMRQILGYLWTAKRLAWKIFGTQLWRLGWRQMNFSKMFIWHFA